MPSSDTYFKKGNPGGKGRVSGRTKALRLLDDVLSEADTQKTLSEALRDYANTKPIDFYKSIVMPLLPKNVNLNASGDLQIVVQLIDDVKND